MGDENNLLEDDILDDLSRSLKDDIHNSFIQALSSVMNPPPTPDHLSIGAGNGTISIRNDIAPSILSIGLNNRDRESLMINDNMLKIEHREDGTPMDDMTKTAIRGRILHAIADKAGDKVTYTKRKDLTTNQTIVTGKVWVFNEKELSDFIDEVLKHVR